MRLLLIGLGLVVFVVGGITVLAVMGATALRRYDAAPSGERR